MTKRQKAIKIFSNLDSIKTAYFEYVLFKKGKKSLVNWFGSEEEKYLKLPYYENKIIIKLHSIIYKNSYLKNLNYKQREEYYEKYFYLSFFK
jgi:hypothetical protein